SLGSAEAIRRAQLTACPALEVLWRPAEGCRFRARTPCPDCVRPQELGTARQAPAHQPGAPPSSTYMSRSPGWQPKYLHSLSMTSVPTFAPYWLAILDKVARWTPLASATSVRETARRSLKALSAMSSASLNLIIMNGA